MSQAIRRLTATMARTGMSRTSIYKAIQEGRFPRPVSLGARAVGWLESDIVAWIESRPKATRVPVPKKLTGSNQ